MAVYKDVTFGNVEGLAVFIAAAKYGPEATEVDVFNDWAAAVGFKPNDLDNLRDIIEHVRRFMNLPRCDMINALGIDHVLEPEKKEESRWGTETDMDGWTAEMIDAWEDARR